MKKDHDLLDEIKMCLAKNYRVEFSQSYIDKKDISVRVSAIEDGIVHAHQTSISSIILENSNLNQETIVANAVYDGNVELGIYLQKRKEFKDGKLHQEQK